MVDRYNRADRRDVGQSEGGRVVSETRRSTSRIQRDALVARTIKALRTASNASDRRIHRKTG